MTYLEQLRTACINTEALGMGDARLPQDTAVLPAEALLRAATRLARKTSTLASDIGAADSGNLARLCAAFTCGVMPEFEHAVQRRVVLTLGSVSYEGIPILGTPALDLHEIRRRASYHVWWSLAGGQIVDITLMVHLALLKEARPKIILPIVGAADDIRHIAWRPQLVGAAVVHALTA